MGLARLTHPPRLAAYYNKHSAPLTFFNAQSAWNVPCSAALSSMAVDANNALYMSTTPPGPPYLSLGYWLNFYGGFQISHENFGFSTSLWYGDASVPPAVVYSTSGWDGSVAGQPWPLSPVRIPKAAVVPTGTDGHFACYDLTTQTLYTFYHMVKNSNGTWNADHARADRRWDNGYNSFSTVGFRPGPRAYGGPANGGMIMYHEMRRGLIPHALGFTYTTPRNHDYASGIGVDGFTPNIASCCDADDVNTDSAYNLVEGARIRLKASVNVATRAAGAPIPASAITIGNALQTYGAYLFDRGGHPSLYAEDLTNKSVSWSGLLNAADPGVFLPGDFEVLSISSPLGFRA